MRYFIGGLAALSESKPFKAQLKISGKKVEIPEKVRMITLANGKNEGGRYTISPSSNHADGKLEIIILKPVSNIRLFLEFIKLSLGISFKKNVIEVAAATGEVEIQLDPPQKIHADGEQWPLFTSCKFQVHPQAIPVLINRESGF